MRSLAINYRGAAKFLTITLCGLLIVTLMIIKSRGGSNPENNPDYARVIQLIQAGIVKPSDLSGFATLPPDYAYLSFNGEISVHASVHGSQTRLVFFETSVDSKQNRIDGYLYKENDDRPDTTDFAPLPYADTFTCNRLIPRWFACTYYFH